jgi:hypothetical protein
MLQTIEENYRPTHKYAGTVVLRPGPEKDVP